MQDELYNLVTRKSAAGFVVHNGAYKHVARYFIEPNNHVLERDLALIDHSQDPMEAWNAQLDIIHECSYADAWM